jgi:hypothetical protein
MQPSTIESSFQKSVMKIGSVLSAPAAQGLTQHPPPPRGSQSQDAGTGWHIAFRRPSTSLQTCVSV